MSHKFLHGPKIVSLVVIGVIIGMLLGAGLLNVIYAQNSGRVFHACVNSNSGAIRMIRATEECRQNEIKINWNQRGPQGPPGSTGHLSTYVKWGENTILGPGEWGDAEVYCDSGDRATGGGFIWSNPALDVYTSIPFTEKGSNLPYPNGWYSKVYNRGNSEFGGHVRVICLDTTP